MNGVLVGAGAVAHHWVGLLNRKRSSPERKFWRKKNAKIVLIRGNGYQLEIKDADRFHSWWSDLNEQQAVVSTATNEDRQQALVFLLLTNLVPQTLDDLLDQLFVGKNTFYSYLKTSRSWLSPFNLKIINRPNIGFDLIGSEFNKRQAISELLIKKNLHDYLMDFTPVEAALFNNIDLKKLQQAELSRLASLSLLDSDYFHKNILSSLALSIYRNKHGYKIESILYTLPKLKEDILETVPAFLLNSKPNSLFFSIKTNGISLSTRLQSIFRVWSSMKIIQPTYRS